MKIIDNYVNYDTKKIKVVSEFLEYIIASGLALLFTTVMFITGLVAAALSVRRLKIDPEVTTKLNKLVKDGKTYIVRRCPSKQVNAFANPATGDIVYFTGLQVLVSEKEFYAVLIHEVGHVKQKDKHILFKTWASYSMSTMIVYNAMAFLLASGLVIAYPILILSIYLLNLLTQTVPLAVSRMFEYDADSFAVKMGYGKELASALEKMAKHYGDKTKACSTIFCKIYRKINDIFHTHPNTAKRIEILLKNPKLYPRLQMGFGPSFTFAIKEMDLEVSKKTLKTVKNFRRIAYFSN